MKYLVFLFPALFLLVSCGGTDKFRKEHTEGPSRGESFEQVVLLETDAGLDTLIYVRIPFRAGNMTIRLHDELNLGVVTRLNSFTEDQASVSVDYRELLDEEVAKQVTSGGFSSLLTNYTTQRIGAAQGQGSVLFIDAKGRWRNVSESGKEDIVFLRDMISEQVSDVYDGQFLVRDIYSSNNLSTIITYRLKNE